MRKLFFLILLSGIAQLMTAQDTLLLITGRKIIVSSVDLSNNSIAYRAGDKLKTINPERVFSVKYKSGEERIIYGPDSLDPLDFKVEEMRNFIHGEQDARELYRNNLIKVAGVAIGGGSAFLGFFGVVGPPVFATVVGSYSPKIENKLSFNVDGSAASELGITPGKYLNTIKGNKQSPLIKQNQTLTIANKKLKFEKDTGLDSAVAMINSKFNCIRVHASKEDDKIHLFKSEYPALISDNPYREGFEKKVRDYKIRNAMISGLVGFLVSGLTLNFIFKD